MKFISSFFSQFRKHVDIFNSIPSIPGIEKLTPITSGGIIAQTSGINRPEGINIGAAFYLWWKNLPENRIVYRMLPETSGQIASVGLSFIPEFPPAAWKNGVILIESHNFRQPLFSDIFSICGYHTYDRHGILRYYFIALDNTGGIQIFGIRSDIGQINAQLANAGKLLDSSYSITDSDKIDMFDSIPADMQKKALDIIRFVFASSYYLKSPERIKKSWSPGPREKNKRGKVSKKSAPLWSYYNANLIREGHPGQDQEKTRPLNKEGLSLEPVIVSPYIQRRDDKVIIVHPHESHRWKRKEGKIGKKISV